MAAANPPAQTPKMGVYRLKMGAHVAADPNWSRPKDAEGYPVWRDRNGDAIVIPDKVYRPKPGENIVHSDVDLVKKFGDEKFEYVVGGVMDQTASAANAALLADIARLSAENAELKSKNDQSLSGGDLELTRMSVNQLKELAATEEIDLDGASKKDDIVAAIALGRSARSGK